MTRLDWQSALVTGASRGIGLATAEALARAGVKRLYLHYNSHAPGAQEALDRVRACGSEGELWQANLGTDEGISALADRAKGTQIDVLVNNAGSLVKRAKVLEYTAALFDEVMDLNVKSTYFLAQAVVPGMLERKGGVIVNVSSVAARNGGGPGATIYAAAKAAVSCIPRVSRESWRPAAFA